MLPATTVARVKELIEIKTDDAEHDARILQLITEVTAAAEKIMRRHLWAEARVEQFNVRAGQRVFMLQGWGHSTSAVSEVINSWNRDFAGTTAEDAEDWYYDPSSGLLTFDTDLEAGFGALRVTSSAGLAVSTAGLIADHPDLAGAIEAQVGHLFQRRGELGVQNVSFQGGSMSAGDEPARWLKMPREIVESYRRKRIGG